VTIADAVHTSHRPLPRKSALASALARCMRVSSVGMLIVGSAAAPLVALAQGVGAERRADLEEVTVVRSRNRLEPLKDVPLSVSTLSALELDRESVVNIDDFARRVTNLTFNSGNPRQSSLSIRGVGKQAQTDAQDPSVGIIVDGVNYAYNAMSFYDFTDIEAIEVTRGPQGTLLGKNTTLGVLNIITKRPSFEPDANISVQFGQDDSLFVRGAGGGALIDDELAWRVSFYSDRRQGPYANAYDNGNRSNTDRNRSGGRAQLLWTPTEDISVRFSADITPRTGENTNGLTFRKLPPEFYADGTPVNLGAEATTRLARRWFAQQDNYTVDGDYLGNSERRLLNNDAQQPIFTGTKGGSVYVDWQLGDFTLTSITAYKDYYFDARNDEGTPFDVTKNQNTTVNYDQTSQEFRISSNTTGSFDYQAGLFLFKSQNIYDAKANWGSDAGAWFANAQQYQRLDADGAGRNLLLNSLERLFVQGTENIRNSNAAVFAQANWHIADAFTVTFGGRLTRENRKNHYVREILDNGYGAELNPVAINGVATGGFASNATTGALQPGNTLAQLQRADFTAQKYFGVAPTANPGEAYSSLGTDQLAQIAAAKALRQGQIGLLNAPVDGAAYEETQPAYLISPSWRLTDDHTAYASFQYGEKAGIVQFTNGIPNNAEAEESLNYELGLKSILLDGTLRLYTSVYHNDIKNYQQSVRVYDTYTTNLRNDGLLYYASATGNVPRVLARGVELDGTYTGIDNLSIRFNAAYSDATYRDFPNSAQPSENGYVGAAPFRDVTGEQLPGNARWTFSVGGEYSIPVFSNKELSLSLNHFHTAKYNSDNALSSYGWVPSHGITDLGLGLGADDGSWASRVIVRNVFDTDKRAEGWNSWSPVNVPRWVGLELRASL
jgi:iron complex outermembrane receptor protein